LFYFVENAGKKSKVGKMKRKSKRKNRWKRIFTTFLILVINISAVQHIFNVAHEQVHKRIFEIYGIDSKIICIPSKYLCVYGITHVTNKTQVEQLSPSELKELLIFQLFNEVYGYPINAIIIVVTIMATIDALVVGEFLIRKLKRS